MFARGTRNRSHTTTIASFAICAPSEGDDAVVLCEGAHWSDGAKSSNSSVQAVRKHAALDAAVEQWSIDLKPRNIASGRNISDRFHREDDVDCQKRQYEGWVDTERERMDPDEARDRRTVNPGSVEIATGSGYNASNEKTWRLSVRRSCVCTWCLIQLTQCHSRGLHDR